MTLLVVSSLFFAFFAAQTAASTNETTTSTNTTTSPTTAAPKTPPNLACTQIDYCSCNFTDGSRHISLKTLPRMTYTGYEDSVTVVYEPCSPFTYGPNVNQSRCSVESGSVMCEKGGETNPPFYESLAVVSQMKFIVDRNTQSVTVQYVRPTTHGTPAPNATTMYTYVRLVCDACAHQPVLHKTKITGHNWYFDLKAASNCRADVTRSPYNCSSSPSPSSPSPSPSSFPSPSSSSLPSPLPDENCNDMQHCGKDLVIAVPVTAGATAIIAIMISCCVIKYKERRVGRYYTL